MKPYKIIILFLLGILIGWFLPDCHSPGVSNPITIHDTLKLPTVSYKLLPGAYYNVDSLTAVINQYWKDSLKNLYGHGLFESKFSKVDEIGKRDYTLSSRIPIDPQSSLIVDEAFVFPKRTFGIIGSLGTKVGMGLKYYIVDSKRFSFTGLVTGDYVLDKKCWTPNVQLECEYRF
jgi:hypothetical protein